MTLTRSLTRLHDDPSHTQTNNRPFWFANQTIIITIIIMPMSASCNHDFSPSFEEDEPSEAVCLLSVAQLSSAQPSLAES